jgi:hypothetical protein
VNNVANINEEFFEKTHYLGSKSGFHLELFDKNEDVLRM